MQLNIDPSEFRENLAKVLLTKSDNVKDLYIHCLLPIDNFTEFCGMCNYRFHIECQEKFIKRNNIILK